MITLEKVKLYCRIDTTDDDQMLQGLITAATALIKEQSGKKTYIGDGSGEPVAIDETELFQTCVCQLVEHWYDWRGAADGTQMHHIPYTADMLIAHLKYSCEYAADGAKKNDPG
ncbi:MAG: phage gp6-like head-tail connector protein [Acidaminococcaceae bacterium]|nr:phage gp6-like head-tail connector protein [Acidaminococcaceae bacterium]